MKQTFQAELEVNVSVRIGFRSQREMLAVMNALIPDNVNFPEGLFMKMQSLEITRKERAGKREDQSKRHRETRSGVLSLRFASKKLPVATLANTIDEVLEHITVAKKVVTAG